MGEDSNHSVPRSLLTALLLLALFLSGVRTVFAYEPVGIFSRYEYNGPDAFSVTEDNSPSRTANALRATQAQLHPSEIFSAIAFGAERSAAIAGEGTAQVIDTISVGVRRIGSSIREVPNRIAESVRQFLGVQQTAPSGGADTESLPLVTLATDSDELARIKLEIERLNKRGISIESPVRETVIERIITIPAESTKVVFERSSSESALAGVDARLDQLNNKLASEVFRLEDSLSGRVSANTRTIQLTNRINELKGATFTNSIFSGTIDGLTDAHIPNDITVNAGGIQGDIAVSTLSVTSSATSTIASSFVVDTDTLYVNAVSNQVGIGTSSPSSGFALAVHGNAILASTTVSGLRATGTVWVQGSATSTFDGGVGVGGLSSSNGITLSGGVLLSTVSGTSTFSGGFNVTGGCLAQNGVCLGTTAGGWTDTDGTVLLTTATDIVGIGTTSPSSKLTIWGRDTFVSTESLFNIASRASSTLFTVLHGGNVGIGTTTPSSGFALAVHGNVILASTTISGLRATSTIWVEGSATSTFDGGVETGGILVNGRGITISANAGAILNRSTATSTFAGGLGVTSLAASQGVTITGGSLFQTNSATSTLTGGLVTGGLSLTNGLVITSGSLENTSSAASYFTGALGIATTSPWGALSVEQTTTNPAFVVSNSGSTTPSLYVSGTSQDGRVGIGTANPSITLSLLGGASFIGGNGTSTDSAGTTDFPAAASSSVLTLTKTHRDSFALNIRDSYWTSGLTFGTGDNHISNEILAKSAISFVFPGTNPDWQYNSVWNLNTGDSISEIGFGDLDADGDMDAVVHGTSIALRIYENTGSSHAPQFSRNTNWESGLGTIFANGLQYGVELVDMNGDGDLDLLHQVDHGGLDYRIRIAWNVGTPSLPAWNYASQNSINISGGVQDFAVADLDGDGDFDLINSLRNDQASTAYENVGSADSPSFTANSAWNIPSFRTIQDPTTGGIALGDIDGDGDIDALVADGTRSMLGYENIAGTAGPIWRANTSWNATSTAVSFQANAAPDFVDIDGDGDLDLYVCENNGICEAFENVRNRASALAISGLGIGVSSSTPVARFSVEAPTSTLAAFQVSIKGSSTPAFLIAGGSDNGRVGIGTTSPSSGFALAVHGNAILASTTVSGLRATGTVWVQGSATSTFDGGVGVGGLSSSNGITLSGGVLLSTVSGTSTFSGGFNVTGGCLAQNGVCLGTTAGGWTDTDGTVLLTTATDIVGIGTTSPSSKLTIWGRDTLVSTDTLFNVVSRASSTLFTVLHGGGVGIGTTSPSSGFALAVHGNAILASTTVSGLRATSTIWVEGSATSTFDGGLSAGGFVSSEGLTLTGGSLSLGSATINSTAFTAGSLVFSNGTNFTQDNTSLFFNDTANYVGLGTTSPSSKLTIWGPDTLVSTDTLFNVVSRASSTLFTVLHGGRVGIGTTTPSSGFALAVHGDALLASTTVSGLTATGTINVRGITASSTFANGIILSGGCFQQLDGTCAGRGATIGSTVSGGTAGSVLFVDASTNLNQDNTNFYWNDTVDYLGLGTTSPSSKLTIWGPDTLVSTDTLFNVVSRASSTLFTVLHGGGVGIGTTSPSSGFALAVHGNAILASTTVSGLRATSTIWVEGSATSTFDGGIETGGILVNGRGITISANAGAILNRSTATSTWSGGLSTVGLASSQGLRITGGSINQTGGASSTLSNGIDITAGCFSINGSCVAGAGGGTITGSGAANQVAYWSGATAITGSANLVFDPTHLKFGIATATPSQYLSIGGGALFGSTTVNGELTTGTAFATSSMRIATTSTQYAFVVDGVGLLENWIATSTTATSTFAGGLATPLGDFVYERGSGKTYIDQANLTSLKFDTSAGSVSWVNLPVSSTTASSTAESYTAYIADLPAITVFGRANEYTVNSVNDLGVAIGTTSPASRLTVWGGGTGTKYAFQVVDNASTTRVVIQDNGLTGFGTTTPEGTIAIDNTNNNTKPALIIKATGSGNGANAIAIDAADTCQESGAAAADCVLIDLAELFPTLDSTLRAGEIVSFSALSDEHVERATQASNSRIAGIISTSPAIVFEGNRIRALGGKFEKQNDKVALALAGRVPVKVTLDGGSIYRGDPVTISSTPGYGARATTTGTIIGTALTSFTATSSSATSTIIVFVNTSHYAPDAHYDVLASLAEGTLTARNGIYTGLATNTVPFIGSEGLLTSASTFVYDQVSGRLGIGTTTPGATLAVAGDVLANVFTSISTTTPSTFRYASTTALTANDIYTTLDINSLTFIDSRGKLESASALVYDRGNQRLGIGTTTPTHALTVSGSISARDILLSGSATTSSLATDILAANSVTATSLTTGTLTATGDIVTSRTANSLLFVGGRGELTDDLRLSFSTSTGSLSATRLVADSFILASSTATSSIAGSLGIGTTTPDYKLQVMGDIAATGFVNISTGKSKKNIEYLNDEEERDILDKLDTINIARYHYLSEPSSEPTRLGLIAEEAPVEVLSASGKGVDLYKLTSFALAAVKAQKGEIDNLNISLAGLESRIQAITGQADGRLTLDDVRAGLANLGTRIESGVTRLRTLIAENITTEKLCVDEVCITGEQFKTIVDGAGVTTSSVAPNVVEPSAEPVTVSQEPIVEGADAPVSQEDTVPVTTDESATPTQIEIPEAEPDLTTALDVTETASAEDSASSTNDSIAN